MDPSKERVQLTSEYWSWPNILKKNMLIIWWSEPSSLYFSEPKTENRQIKRMWSQGWRLLDINSANFYNLKTRCQPYHAKKTHKNMHILGQYWDNQTYFSPNIYKKKYFQESYLLLCGLWRWRQRRWIKVAKYRFFVFVSRVH